MTSPYHRGEELVQATAGLRDEAVRVARIINPTLTRGGELFLSTATVVVLAGTDSVGRIWTTARTGRPGFVRTTPNALHIIGGLACDDPLAGVRPGAAIGAVAIDMASRRRFRINGTLTEQSVDGITLAVDEAYGNCPKYIDVNAHIDPDQLRGGAGWQTSCDLGPAARDLVTRSRTFFIGTRNPGGGADSSHRGGPAGFVAVDGPGRLHFPDYDGNAMFNTLGNLMEDPAVGLLVIDPAGRSLQLTGRAAVVFHPPRPESPEGRAVHVTVEEVRTSVPARGEEPVGPL